MKAENKTKQQIDTKQIEADKRAKALRKKAREIAKSHGETLQNSYILYLGPSQIDPSAEITAIVSGFVRPSKNDKTKDVLQVTFFRTDMHPQDAINNGCDSAICHLCPFTKTNGNGIRLCYVRMQPIFAQYQKFQRGTYQLFPTMDLFDGWKVRLGNYGDPACMPVEISHDIKRRARKMKAYTHAWKDFPELQTVAMASVETDNDFVAAQMLGFSCFRVKVPADNRNFIREVTCLNKQKNISCSLCPLCEGNQQTYNQNNNQNNKKKPLHVTIPFHGFDYKIKEFERRFTPKHLKTDS